MLEGGLPIPMVIKNRTADDKTIQKKTVNSVDSKKESVGYTFCDACNEIPFCGIKFYKRGNIITRIESWPDFPASIVPKNFIDELEQRVIENPQMNP